MRTISTAICIAALAIATSAAARIQPPSTPAEVGGAASASQVRCARVEMPASRIRSIRCHTAQGWEMLGVDLKQK